ncbi:MAG: hypothetical protein ACO1RA_23035 [Planctomycetaceae bacterium]
MANADPQARQWYSLVCRTVKRKEDPELPQTRQLGASLVLLFRDGITRDQKGMGVCFRYEA